MRYLTSVLKDLRANGLRSVLTSLTMLIGVLAVIAVTLAGSVARDMFVAHEEQLNGREATFSTSTVLAQGNVADTDSIYRALRAKIGDQDAAVVISLTTTLSVTSAAAKEANRPTKPMVVVWVEGDLNSIQRLPVVSGAMYGHTALPPTIVVNEAAAGGLGVPPRTSVILQMLNGNTPTSFHVSGVVADGQSEPRAYGDLDAVIDWFPEALTDAHAEIRIRAATESLDSVTRIVRDVAAQHGLVIPGQTTRSDTVQRVIQQLETLQAFFAWTAVIVLAIAALGLMNVGLASVKERARELVIRRALGARRRDIFGLVLGASLAIVVIVGLVGVLIAIVAVYVIVPAVIPPSSAITSPGFPVVACLSGLTAAIATAAMGSAAPAIRAARLPVALALRV